MTINCKEFIKKYLNDELAVDEKLQFNLHLTSCRRCKERVESYDMMRKVVTELKCPDSILLFQLHNNELNAEQSNKVEEHLKICHKCTHEYQGIISWLDNQESIKQELGSKTKVIDFNHFKNVRKALSTDAYHAKNLRLAAKSTKVRKISSPPNHDKSPDNIILSMGERSIPKEPHNNIAEGIFEISGVKYLTAEILKSGDVEIAICGIVGGDGSAFLRFHGTVEYSCIRIGHRELKLEAQDEARTIMRIANFTLKDMMQFLNQ